MQKKSFIVWLWLWAQSTFLIAQGYDPKELIWMELGYDSGVQPFFIENYQEIDGPAFGINTIQYPGVSYDSMVNSLLKERTSLARSYQLGEIPIDSVSKYFQDKFLNSLIPYWYGTEWDFNGYTDVPNEGYIACGYFISTTLKHFGVNWNRYKLAQQAAYLELKTVAFDERIHRLGNATDLQFLEYVDKNLDDGLYLLGLSYHVGFLLVRKGVPFFIHANMGFPFGVVTEYADQTIAFDYTWDYFLVSISHNKKFLEKWLIGEKIHVVTE